MALVTISEDDILRSKLVSPGKYGFKIEKVEVKPSKGDGKPVYHCNIKGLNGDAKGVPILLTISSKMPKIYLQLLSSSGVEVVPGEFDTDFLTDKQVGGLLVTGQNQDGSDKNDIVRFFPIAELEG